MATHPSIFAWRIPWAEEPGRLQSVGSQRVGRDWATNAKKTFSQQSLWNQMPSLSSVKYSRSKIINFTKINYYLIKMKSFKKNKILVLYKCFLRTEREHVIHNLFYNVSITRIYTQRQCKKIKIEVYNMCKPRCRNPKEVLTTEFSDASSHTYQGGHHQKNRKNKC